MVKSRRAIKRRLKTLEREMEAQTLEVLGSQNGWGGTESLFWDKRCVERATLRWVLGKKQKQFNVADTMAGW